MLRKTHVGLCMKWRTKRPLFFGIAYFPVKAIPPEKTHWIGYILETIRPRTLQKVSLALEICLQQMQNLGSVALWGGCGGCGENVGLMKCLQEISLMSSPIR